MDKLNELSFLEARPGLTIYIMCHNEEIMLPFTVNSYKKLFPSLKLVICDNNSTDKSVEVAKSLGCDVIHLEMKEFDEDKFTEFKNTIWKSATTDWVIMCDMDEILCCNEAQLKEEDAKGTTILKTKGHQIIGDSQSERLDDIDLTKSSRGFPDSTYDKCVCFKKSKITDINYGRGSHSCSPIGEVMYSTTIYSLYHYRYVGFPYFSSRVKGQFKRRKSTQVMNIPAFNSENSGIRKRYDPVIKCAEAIPALETFFSV
jgi:glycosyltransferase involved in cell wall biosynthesis